MKIGFDLTYDERRVCNPERVQAWLRGKGIKEALVFYDKIHPRQEYLYIEVPMGTSTVVCKQAIKEGCQ